MFRVLPRSRLAFAATQAVRRGYQDGGQARVEQQVASGGSAPVSIDAQLKAALAQVDPSRVDKVAVWSLWNEGNLFSLTIPELVAFLQKENIDLKAIRKSALVRQVEDVLQQFSPDPSQIGVADDTVASITGHINKVGHVDDASAATSEVFDQADDYGDWGADPAFEEKRGVEFMSLAPAGDRAKNMRLAHLSATAFQLLHEEASGELALGQFDPSKLPGFKKSKAAFVPLGIPTEDANRLAFRKAFQWSTHSLWNLGLDGEINIGAGKALYKREVAKRNRSVLPTWTCEDHLNMSYPYSWFAVAHDSNVSVIENLASEMNMKRTSDSDETTFKVKVLRTKDLLDIDLNAELQPIQVNKPWERIYMCHYLRSRMPDLRYLVRARRAIKKKVVESYIDARFIQLDDDTASTVLSPEMGDIIYCCECVRRRWSTDLESGVQLSLLETRRTPLITDRQGDDGERLEYELIANIPQQVEHVDLHEMADDLWARGNQMATLLEDGMTELQAHTMVSSAAFEPVVMSPSS